MSAKATSTPKLALMSCATWRRLSPKRPPGYSAPAAGAYFSGSADFNIFTASNVSLPVPCRTLSTDCSYMASKVLLATFAPGPRPPTAKPRRSPMATAGTEPARVRGSAPPMATARNGDCSASFHAADSPVQPAIFGGLHARRARLHVILRVKVRAGVVGRARSMHHGQMFLVPQRLERAHGRMQAEETVKIDHVLAGNGDRPAHTRIRLLGVRHHDVQAVGRTALKQHYQALALGAAGSSLGGINRAREEARNNAGAYHGQRAILEKHSASDCHVANSVIPCHPERSRGICCLSRSRFLAALVCELSSFIARRSE